MAAKAIARLVEAAGYPERVSDDAVFFMLQVDGAEIAAEETGGRIRLSCKLAAEAGKLPELARYAAGRMLREEATLAYGPLRGAPSLFLWQDAPATADSLALKRLFETFADSCDWWRARLEENGAQEGEGAPELMIRP